jgi:hypothetical protein
MAQITTADGTVAVPHGCYVDGHHGQYAPEVIVGLVDPAFGTNYAERLAAARDTDDFDAITDLTDEMLDVLNDATTDGVWDWFDGELFLVGVDEHEETWWM